MKSFLRLRVDGARGDVGVGRGGGRGGGRQGVTKFFASYEQKSSTCPFLQDTRMITAS